MSDNRGETLIGVVIAAGLAAIVFGVMSQLTHNQLQSQKQLMQKYEMLDFKQALLTALQNGNICKFNLRPMPSLSHSANVSFDASTWDDATTPEDETDGRIELARFSNGASADAAPLAIAGARLPGSQTGLVVDKIKLKNLRPIDPSAPADLRLDWQGVWEVSFRPDSQIIALSPARVTQFFRVVHDASHSPEDGRKIEECQGVSMTNANSVSVSCDMTLAGSGAPNTRYCNVECPTGYSITGGGYNWANVFSGAGRYSRPLGNGWQCGINIGSCSSGTVDTGCDSLCYALCVK